MKYRVAFGIAIIIFLQADAQKDTGMIKIFPDEVEVFHKSLPEKKKLAKGNTLTPAQMDQWISELHQVSEMIAEVQKKENFRV